MFKMLYLQFCNISFSVFINLPDVLSAWEVAADVITRVWFWTQKSDFEWGVVLRSLVSEMHHWKRTVKYIFHLRLCKPSKRKYFRGYWYRGVWIILMPLLEGSFLPFPYSFHCSKLIPLFSVVEFTCTNVYIYQVSYIHYLCLVISVIFS